MGIKEIKAAFEDALGDDYSCNLALMDTVRDGAKESLVLFFRGNDPSGAQFEVKSDPIGPIGDLIQAAKDTAQRVLNAATPAK